MTDTLFGTESGAAISDCGLYRYRLWRAWGDGPRMAFVMLNPSTADASTDDPTIRRCVGFAKRERFDGIEVVNLYALRATKPTHLLDHPDPEGPENSVYWNYVLNGPLVGPVVAAWGAGAAPKLGLDLSRALAAEIVVQRRWLCLGVTKDGAPRHPLYVRGDQPLGPLYVAGGGSVSTDIDQKRDGALSASSLSDGPTDQPTDDIGAL